jgi:hypothetical protein
VLRASRSMASCCHAASDDQPRASFVVVVVVVAAAAVGESYLFVSMSYLLLRSITKNSIADRFLVRSSTALKHSFVNQYLQLNN